jgi:hypothetical protein
MKKLIILIGFIIFNISLYGQETYNIGNETLELKTEVEGNLDLLWTIDNSKYRYFVRTEDGNIQELVNTKNPDTRKYQEEYKTVLNNLTTGSGLSTKNMSLTLFSLKEFINRYDATTNVDFTYEPRAKMYARLGVFGGITNQPLAENPNNVTVPFFGVDFEVFSKSIFPRNALFFQARHGLDNDEFEYSSTQLSIGYRYRFINKTVFNIYGNLKIVTYDFIQQTFLEEGSTTEFFTENTSALQVPFILGIGADIKVSKNGYIMFAYHDIYALFVDNGGNFPIDFAVGFKFNL